MPPARAQGPGQMLFSSTLGGEKPGVWSFQTLQVGAGVCVTPIGGLGAIKGLSEMERRRNKRKKEGHIFFFFYWLCLHARSNLATCQFLDVQGPSFCEEAEPRWPL